MPLLEVSHLRKTYGELVAVDDVSFHVEAGEIFGLLGPNGAGKSTSMMMIAGLTEPDSGSVTLDGHTAEHGHRSRTLRTILGVVPQDLAIYPELTAHENLAFFGRLYGLRGAALKDRVDNSLERTGLTGRAHDAAGNYSGGMKRRLNFGVALLHEPRLLILDEPTVGVDPQSRAHLLDCVRQLQTEGVAIIYASHYMEEVQSMCSRVAIIDHGKMLRCDTLRALLDEMSSDVVLHIDDPPPGLASRLAAFGKIADVDESDGETTIVIARDKPGDDDQLNHALMNITQRLNEAGAKLRRIETHEPNLERLFLKLTGNKLRD